MSDDMKSTGLLISGAEKIGIDLSDKQTEQFNRFTSMLTEWNAKFNLTRITEPNEIIVKHYLDSLSIAAVIDIKKYKTVMDVGTGAGFPGIPLKIVFPHLEITMLDSVKKRLSFIDIAIKELELTGASTIHARAEDAGRDLFLRDKYDLTVSRALARLNILTELCTPFCKRGGIFVSYKGFDIDIELAEAKNAITKCGCRPVKTEKTVLPDTDIRRALVIIEKIKKTPDQYPRKAGIPSKQPLI